MGLQGAAGRSETWDRRECKANWVKILDVVCVTTGWRHSQPCRAPRPALELALGWALLRVPGGVFSVRVRCVQRGVQIDHDFAEGLPGRPRFGQFRAGQLPAGRSSSGPCLTDRAEDGPVNADRHSSDLEVDVRLGPAVQSFLISQRLDVGGRPCAVGERVTAGSTSTPPGS